ncbi:BACON domain-containing protein [Streptomyces sp. CA-294286]|uniref:BACON domain-containing protein n=1 Tax=Streptomyces sp. CA-294286 TaxID=3240070 RepID=UPI003D94DD0A
MTTSRREHPTQSTGSSGPTGSGVGTGGTANSGAQGSGSDGSAAGTTGIGRTGSSATGDGATGFGATHDGGTNSGATGSSATGFGATGDSGTGSAPSGAPDEPGTLRRAPRACDQQPSTRYEPYLDGLFTYALCVLRDHDLATTAIGEVLALAERSDSRSPAAEPERKAWLYALARWNCLRRLTDDKRRRQGAHGRHGDSGGRGSHAHRPAPPVPEPELPVEEGEARRRHADLARLAWPEAAGTTPEQREALELAVRHGLGARQVAAVLGLEPLAARELLAAAACEVERTRAALVVVETGTCPTVTRLAGDDQVLLSTALRGELVRHVDDCPLCRRAAERAGARGPWPGTGASPGDLPLVEAPRATAYAAMVHAPRMPRSAAPRFDRGGFPLDPKDRAARRERLRTRAVTTTVVATVVAAPVLALWAAYRGAPVTGDGHRDTAITASEEDGLPGHDGLPYDGYRKTGTAHGRPDPTLSVGNGVGDVTVKVLTPGRGTSATGRNLAVRAETAGGTTVVRLTASGGPVVWSMWADAHWLHLSRTTGTLAAGESFTVYVTVDRDKEPTEPWTARLGVAPSGAVLSVSGRGTGAWAAPGTQPEPGAPPGPGPHPGPGGHPGPGETPPPGGTPGPGPAPTDPAPQPTEPSATTAPPEPTEPPTTPPPATDPPSSPPAQSDPPDPSPPAPGTQAPDGG